MAVTESSFKDLFPEFAVTDSAIVNRCILFAEDQVSETVFGDSYEHAVSYLTAHYVSQDPRGEPTAQAYGGGGVVGTNIFKGERAPRGGSRYLEAYERMRASLIAPISIA